MALAKWQLLREIILHNASGTLIVQRGRDYQHWCIESGRLRCVSTTLTEHSFTQFVLQNLNFPQQEFLRAQLLVDDTKPLGAVLLQQKLLTTEQLRDILCKHSTYLSYFLFLSTSHLFWSSRSTPLKSDLVHWDLPFSELILGCERSSIEASCAIRLVQELITPYRLIWNEKLESLLQNNEKRVLQYVKADRSLGEMFRDPELDRMTCYRTLFLLWLSGHLRDSSSRQTISAAVSPKSLPRWIRLFPADWIFPLVGGAVIGVLLAPSPSPPKEPPVKMESWRSIDEKPPWSTAAEGTEKKATEDTEFTEKK